MDRYAKNTVFWIACLSFCVGIGVSHYCLDYLQIKIILTLAFGLVSFLSINNSYIFPVAIYLCFFGLGNLRTEISKVSYNTNTLVSYNKANSKVRLYFRVEKSLPSTQRSRQYLVSVLDIEDHKVLEKAIWRTPISDILMSDNSMAYAYTNITPLIPKNNPYTFDYTLYLKKLGATHQFYTKLSETHIAPIPDQSWSYRLSNLKQKLSDNLNHLGLSADVLQLVKALVLGDKLNMDKGLRADFVNAGVIHLLAISGLHIGILYGVISFFFRRLLYKSERSPWVSLCILLLLWVFVAFTGFSASALRATTMFSILEFSKIIRRRQHPINALCLSVLILTMIQPDLVFDVGFQLSVLAVLAILIIIPIALELWRPKSFIVRSLWGIILVTMAAQIGVFPLTIYYFHQFPLLFLLANIPLMICIGPLLGVTFILVALSFLPIPSLLIDLYDTCFMFVIHYVRWIASHQYFILKDLYFTSFSVVGLYICFGISLYIYFNKQRYRYVLSSLVLALVMLIAFVELNFKKTQQGLYLLSDYQNTLLVNLDTTDKLQVYSSGKPTQQQLDYLIKPIKSRLDYTEVSCSSIDWQYSYNGTSISYFTKETAVTDMCKGSIWIIDDSPNLDLEEMIQKYSPQKIVFTYKNYKTLTDKWKVIAARHLVPVFDVRTQGAYQF